MRAVTFLPLALLFTTSPVYAQSAGGPTSIAQVIDICAPVIAEEYEGDVSRWGTCVRATEDFLTIVVGPPPSVDEPNAVIADLVYQLALLYRFEDCPEHPTELPEAIAKALSFSTDPDQRALIEDIQQSVAACEALETGSVSYQGTVVSPN